MSGLQGRNELGQGCVRLCCGNELINKASSTTEGRAPTFGDFLPTYNNPPAGAAAF